MISATGLSVILLIALAVLVPSYFLYPYVEALLEAYVIQYVDHVVDIRERMFARIERKQVVLAIAVSTVSLGCLGFFLSQGFGFLNFLFTLLFTFVGWSIPRWAIRLAWYRRIRKFDLQLVDGLNLMANSLKSGLNLSQVIQVLVAEMPNPISQEFGLVLSQQQLGLSLEEALEKMLERIPSDDLSVAIHSILILRETGGDLSETFDVIANTIRERRKVDGKIKSMTQQGKMQGLLLFLMPAGIGVLLYFMNPEFMLPLFTTRLGWMMISVMLLFQFIGGLWLKKIVTIEV